MTTVNETEPVAPVSLMRLNYLMRWGLEPEGYDGGDIAIARVHEVDVRRHAADVLVVNVSGPMLTKKGGAGPNRSSNVDLRRSQPEWLMEIIGDAAGRLHAEYPVAPAFVAAQS